MLQNGGVKKETSPEEYWADVAEEIGEPVRAYALARIADVAGPEQTGMLAPRPEWGLVFITDSALYVERGSPPNWFQRLVMNRQGHEAPTRDAIRIDSMTKVIIPPPRTGLRRILAVPEIVVEIHHDGTPGVLQPRDHLDVVQLRLVLDQRGPNDKLLIDILSGLMPGG